MGLFKRRLWKNIWFALKKNVNYQNFLSRLQEHSVNDANFVFGECTNWTTQKGIFGSLRMALTVQCNISTKRRWEANQWVVSMKMDDEHRFWCELESNSSVHFWFSTSEFDILWLCWRLISAYFERQHCCHSNQYCTVHHNIVSNSVHEWLKIEKFIICHLSIIPCSRRKSRDFIEFESFVFHWTHKYRNGVCRRWLARWNAEVFSIRWNPDRKVTETD